MRLLGSLALFLVCLAFANLSAWAACLAIARLPTGLSVVVVFGTPLTLFLLPGLVLRSIKRRALRQATPRQLPPAETGGPSPEGTAAPPPTGKPKEPPTDDGSLLGGAAVVMIVMGILCPLSMLLVGPAASPWVDLQSGQALESATVDEALQHPEAVYISLKDGQVHGDLLGSSKYRVGRGDYTVYYAVPVVTEQGSIEARPPEGKAAARETSKTKERYEPKLKPLRSSGKGRSFTLWVGTTDQRRLATLNAQPTIGGRVQRLGGDYAESIDDAVRRHDLGPIAEPFVIELGAPTHREALEETQLWAWLGLGIFNLLFMALAGLMTFTRGSADEPTPRSDGRV